MEYLNNHLKKTILISLFSGINAADRKKPSHVRLLSALECLACNIFCNVFLIIPQETDFAFAGSIGTALIIDGIVRIFITLIGSLQILPSS